MARPLRVEYEGAFYHITSRGNERKDIFKSEKDKEKFLNYLERAKEKFEIVVHAYCLLSNHYHLIIETPYANLSKCMQYINSSYTTYYNVKRNRHGHLFQGRYKGILIEVDEYLKVLSRYIHLNPIKAGMEKRLGEYKWSSYYYYIEKKKLPVFLKTQHVLDYFGGSKVRYRKYVEEGVLKDIANPLEKINQWNILGCEGFINMIQNNYLKEKKEDRDLPRVKNIKKSFSRIVAEIKKVKDVSEKEQRKLLVYFLRKYTDFNLEEIADRLGGKKLSVSGVSVITARLEKDKDNNKRLAQVMKRVDVILSNV